MATPRFVPGAGESPLVTWGDIEGTPLRLDEEEPLAVPLEKGSAGPAFRVPETSKREQLARDMAARKAPASLFRKPASGLLRTPLMSTSSL